MPSVVETYHTENRVSLDYFSPGTADIPYEFDRSKAAQLLVVACDAQDEYTTVFVCRVTPEIARAPKGTALEDVTFPIISELEVGRSGPQELVFATPSLGIEPVRLVVSHCVSMTPN